MSPLQSAKFHIGSTVGLAKDAMHIYVALIVLFGAAALFRLPLRDWRLWLVVLGVTLAGETWDVIDTVRDGGKVRYGDNWKDLWNTMFWPSVIVLLARYTGVFRR